MIAWRDFGLFGSRSSTSIYASALPPTPNVECLERGSSRRIFLNWDLRSCWRSFFIGMGWGIIWGGLESLHVKTFQG